MDMGYSVVSVSQSYTQDKSGNILFSLFVQN